MDNAFYDESSEQSRVKAAIVSKYFRGWANVMIPTLKRWGGDRLVYADVFCGPGRYKDGTPSTPLLVIQQAIEVPALGHMLVTHFNDADPSSARLLAEELRRFPGIETLRHKPQITNKSAADALTTLPSSAQGAPTLLFADPWGYKALSLDLIGSVLRNWGCDCIFFFNYLRVNMALQNDLFAEHMYAIFGKTRAHALSARLTALEPQEREMTIIEELAEALRDQGGKFILPFAFHNESGERTSHHLIYVSKDFTGYDLMKQIMARQSSLEEQGVASFRYNPADARQPLLFELLRPLDELGSILLNAFAGRILTIDPLYRAHSVGRPFIKKNYQDVIKHLESQGHVTCDPPAAKRMRGGEVTLGPKVQITFPPRPGTKDI
jgi:three-Cys-motif partner protein